MSNRFNKTDLKCLVISPSSTVRGILSSTLKELSFTSITTVADIKTSIEILETEPIQWIIAPVKDMADGHVLHILNIIDRNPALRVMKVSILRDEDDTGIAQAFEMGAFSCHKMDNSKESVLQEFQRLVQRIDRFDGDCTRIAAEYLADFLSEKGEYQELARFFNSLLQIYPNRNDILLAQARNFFRAQQFEEAKVIVAQLMLTAPELRAEVDNLRRSYIPGEEVKSGATEQLAGHFGFKTCLVLDSDPAALQSLAGIVQRLGFAQVETFQDPIPLMKWIRQHGRPDLVISEWQLPNIPGPIFLYKLRRRLEIDVPFIICNQQIKERDATWLKELDVSCLIAKPLIEKDVFKAVLWTMQQSKGPSDLSSLKTKLKLLSKKQDKELARYRQLYLKHPMLIEAERLVMEAQLAYDAGCYLHAKKYALDAIHEAADSREALELLSKSLMKLREFDAALRCLDNASFLSPYNVNYLCEIAECHLENGDDTKFETFLEQARDLDPDAQVVFETEAKGAIKLGHTETAKRLLQNLKSFKEVLGFMNNRAVSLIQVGKHKEGLELYQKALDSLPEGQQEVRALLSYNLGLGYARGQRLKEAADSLEQAVHTKNAQRLKKAQSLRQRVKKALESGEPLVFPAEPEPNIKDEQSKLTMLREIESAAQDANKISRSDYCVNRIYRSLIDDSKAREVLQNAPTFTPRGKLVKDYLHGIIQVPSGPNS